MRRTSLIGMLAVIAAMTAVCLALRSVLRGQGHHLAATQWVEWLAMLALAGVVLWQGWAVRAYLAGKKPSLDGIRAARTVILAKAGAVTGSLLSGWYLAGVLSVIGDWQYPSQRHRAITAGIGMLCAATLLLVSLVVERMCQIPPADSEGSNQVVGTGKSQQAPATT